MFLLSLSLHEPVPQRKPLLAEAWDHLRIFGWWHQSSWLQVVLPGCFVLSLGLSSCLELVTI